MDEMNQYEVISTSIDYYKTLQMIRSANGGTVNKVLDYEIKITRIKLKKFGINLQDFELDF